VVVTLVFSFCFKAIEVGTEWLLVHGLSFGAKRVLVEIDPDIDHGTLSRLGNRVPCTLHCQLNLTRLGNLFAISANHLPELGKRHIAEFIFDISTFLARAVTINAPL